MLGRWRLASAIFALASLAITATTLAGEAKGFDPRSAANTLDWIIEVWEPVLKSKDDRNDLAVEIRQKRLVAAVDSLKGKEIDWTLFRGGSMPNACQMVRLELS